MQSSFNARGLLEDFKDDEIVEEDNNDDTCMENVQHVESDEQTMPTSLSSYDRWAGQLINLCSSVGFPTEALLHVPYLILLLLAILYMSEELFIYVDSIEAKHICIMIGFTYCLYFVKCSEKLKGLIGLLAILAVTVVQCRQPTVNQSFQVSPLFERPSLVSDYAYGELTLLREEILASDMTMVLFYAPWDRQSLEIKRHFMAAALYYHEQINFVSINCWLPGSECRKQSNLVKYPTLVLSVRLPSNQDVMNIQYTAPFTSSHLISFLGKSLKPFQYVNNQQELEALKINNEAIVVGYFDEKSPETKLSCFYYAALGGLQQWTGHTVAYAVTFNSSLNGQHLPDNETSIQLINWNRTLFYPRNASVNVKNITDWVNSRLEFPYQWIDFDDRKSANLNQLLSHGPTLFMLTPHNPFVDPTDTLLMLKAVSMDYYNCGHDANLHRTIGDLEELISARVETNIKCEDYLHRFFTNQSATSPATLANDGICETNTFSYWDDIRQHFSWDSLWSIEKCDLGFGSLMFGLKPFHSSTNQPKNNQTSPSPKHCVRETAKTQDPEEGLAYLADETIPQMKLFHAEQQCKNWALGSTLSPPVRLPKTEGTPISGLGCHSNQTLQFVAINSIDGNELFKRFRLPNRTHVWIVDSKREEHYHLTKPTSLSSFTSFIRDFHERILTRATLSSLVRPNHSPLRLEELTARDYLTTTQRPGQSHVVFHYTPNCGACKSLSHVLLACRHASMLVPNLTFSRIDVSRNILPWPYTFEQLPTIIFHPPFRKAETQVFNATNGVDVQSVMKFLLKNMQPLERRIIASALCDKDCQTSLSADARHTAAQIQQNIDVLKDKLNVVDGAVEPIYHNSLTRKINQLKSKLKLLSTSKDSLISHPHSFSTYLSYQTFLLDVDGH